MRGSTNKSSAAVRPASSELDATAVDEAYLPEMHPRTLRFADASLESKYLLEFGGDEAMQAVNKANTTFFLFNLALGTFFYFGLTGEKLAAFTFIGQAFWHIVHDFRVDEMMRRILMFASTHL